MVSDNKCKRVLILDPYQAEAMRIFQGQEAKTRRMFSTLCGFMSFMSPYEKLLTDIGLSISTDIERFIKDPKSIDLIQYTGGEDVSPHMYGDISPNELCGYNTSRDLLEKEIFEIALYYDIPMVGICRGVQFLNVMCGGKLVHHLNNHGGKEHTVTIVNRSTDTKFVVNSYHHQMCIPGADCEIIAEAENIGGCYIGNYDKEIEWENKDIEGVHYHKQRTIGVQWHPEMMDKNSQGRLFYKDIVKHTLLQE